MAKIVLYLPGNGMHSFLTGDRFERMFKEKCGLKAIGESGFPVAISHQGIDHELFPFLREFHNQYQNLEIVGAPYGHGLLPLIRFGSQKETSAQIKWELKNGPRGTVPITFFSEFYTPAAWAIPTEFFFFLREQTCSYSLEVTGINIKDEHLSIYPKDIAAVDYNGKIGIVIDGFQAFIKAWFAFAAIPSESNLNNLVNEFDNLAEDPREYIVIPMDLEQPYVGSLIGEELWKMFFEAIARRPTSRNIVPLSSILGFCKENAVKIQQPHRVLTKWTVHDVQFKAIMDLNSLRLKSEKERRTFSLAFTSDHLSSLNRMVLSTTKPVSEIEASNCLGKRSRLHNAPNQVLQACCNAAFLTLRHKEYLQNRIAPEAEQNFFAQTILEWARKNNL